MTCQALHAIHTGIQTADVMLEIMFSVAV